MGKLEALWSFLFPPHCPLCHKYVEHRGDWCADCLDKTANPELLTLPASMAAICAEGWSLSIYRGGTQNLIRGLKYQGRRGNVYAISTLLSDVEQLSAIRAFLARSEIAIPVPLHKKRERERGFNQTTLIFKEWLEKQGLVWQEALLRQRETKPMYSLHYKERMENLNEAFALAPQMELQGKAVLLVDDIFTTGATLFACAKLLKAAGAESIRLLVLASDHR